MARIFDIALGVTTIENLIKKEMVAEKEKELAKLIKQQEHLSKRFNAFEEEIDKLCQRAKSLNIVSLEMSNEECIEELKQQLQDISKIPILDNQLELENYEQEKLRLQIKLSKYEKYITQYKKYKNLLKNDADSLKPILYLQENFTDVIDISKTDTIINSIALEFQTIKKFIAQKDSPAIIDLTEKINEIKENLEQIDTNIQNISTDEKVEDTNRKQQLIFLGEVKSSLEFYNQEHTDIDYTESIEKIKNDIKALEKEITEVDRSDTLDTLSEYMQEVFREVDFNLSGYKDYKPIFDFKTKLIHLKKIDEKVIYRDDAIKNIGSSSNHLFLHLAFFAAIHRLFAKKKIPYIPPFLILDQPDSPYYETNDKNSYERKTFFKALETLDKQITFFKNNLKQDFQIIVLEHVEWKELETANFDNFILVDKEWRDGYGLVPIEQPNSD